MKKIFNTDCLIPEADDLVPSEDFIKERLLEAHEKTIECAKMVYYLSNGIVNIEDRVRKNGDPATYADIRNISMMGEMWGDLVDAYAKMLIRTPENEAWSYDHDIHLNMYGMTYDTYYKRISKKAKENDNV